MFFYNSFLFKHTCIRDNKNTWFRYMIFNLGLEQYIMDLDVFKVFQTTLKTNYDCLKKHVD